MLDNTILKTLSNISRVSLILKTFSSYGFQEFILKLGLSKLVPNMVFSHPYKKLSAEKRLRMCFEKLGPAFIKLGQILAHRTDLLPLTFCQELAILHSQAETLDFKTIEKVLINNYGTDYLKQFKEFSTTAIGSGSIAQTYKACMLDGLKVVVKIQKPKVKEIIKEDIKVLQILSKLIEKYIPEFKLYQPQRLVEEFSRQLEMEMDFIVEANNTKKLHLFFKDDKAVKIPNVYSKYSSDNILILEEIKGTSFSQINSLNYQQEQLTDILDKTLKAYLKMLFQRGLYHADLHSGNILYTEDNKIAFIDFGQVGRLNKREQMSISHMLTALSEEDYERFAMEYLDLSHSGEASLESFSSSLQNLIDPYYGVTLEGVKIGQIFMETANLAFKHKIKVPIYLMIFFKSILSLEGTGRNISKNFNFIKSAQEFADQFIKDGHEQNYWKSSLDFVLRDLNHLLLSSPRQLRSFFRKVGDPNFKWKLDIQNLDKVAKAVNRLALFILLGFIFLGLVVVFVNFKQI
ncbi:MAG: AarF/ABC1/UbiB kinase family protein [Bdellovibrionales bacterium]|nr:AarF/ABC1/UbiB kinase family protein [Bdellovibrionales bacterium]